MTTSLWNLKLLSEDLFWKNWNSTLPALTGKATSYNTIKDENSLKVQIAVPGVEREDLDLTLIKNKLIISLEKDTTFVAPFTHVIELQEYNENSIKTNLVNGVLEITVEKTVENKPKKLKI